MYTASDEDQSDYNTAMKKLLPLTSGSKIQNQLCYHSAKHLHGKQSSTSQNRPQVDDEIALQRSRMTVQVSSANKLFQPSCSAADMKDSRLCDHRTNKQTKKLLSYTKFVASRSSPLNELVLPLQMRCHTASEFINSELLRNG